MKYFTLIIIACASVLFCSASQLGYRLTWDANNPLESVTNYSIWIGPADGAWLTNYNCGTNTQCAIYFNDAGTGSLPYPTFAAPWSSEDRPPQVKFAATAQNAYGISDKSETLTVTNVPLPSKGIQIELLTTENSVTIGFDPVPDMARIDTSQDLLQWDEAYIVQTIQPILRPRNLGWQVPFENEPSRFWRMVDLNK